MLRIASCALAELSLTALNVSSDISPTLQPMPVIRLVLMDTILTQPLALAFSVTVRVLLVATRVPIIASPVMLNSLNLLPTLACPVMAYVMAVQAPLTSIAVHVQLANIQSTAPLSPA